MLHTYIQILCILRITCIATVSNNLRALGNIDTLRALRGAQLSLRRCKHVVWVRVLRSTCLGQATRRLTSDSLLKSCLVRLTTCIAIFGTTGNDPLRWVMKRGPHVNQITICLLILDVIPRGNSTLWGIVSEHIAQHLIASLLTLIVWTLRVKVVVMGDGKGLSSWLLWQLLCVLPHIGGWIRLTNFHASTATLTRQWALVLHVLAIPGALRGHLLCVAAGLGYLGSMDDLCSWAVVNHFTLGAVGVHLYNVAGDTAIHVLILRVAAHRAMLTFWGLLLQVRDLLLQQVVAISWIRHLVRRIVWKRL